MRRLLIIPCASWLTGCGLLLGDYATADPGAGDAGTGDRLSGSPIGLLTHGWIPGIPDDGYVESCVECAQEQCGHARNLCADPAHADCWDRLVCASQCDDPDCLMRCEAKQLRVGLACEAECDAADPYCVPDCWDGRARYYALRSCLLDDACVDACNAHRNWQCVGKYSWGPSEGSDPITVRLTVGMGGPEGTNAASRLAGALVERCEPPCLLTHRAVELDETGTATFTGLDTPARVDFDVRTESPVPARLLIVRRLDGHHSHWVDLDTSSLLNPVASPLPNGGIGGAVLDCLGSGALGASVASDRSGAVPLYASGSDRTDGTGLFVVSGVPLEETTRVTATVEGVGEVTSLSGRLPEGASLIFPMHPRWEP